jgi:N-acetylmuramoyl-L-alanine amidase
MELTAEDLQTLTYTLLGEARGEGLAGMYAVANVIRNRADSPAYPDNPVDVALQPWQFSTNNGPNMGGGNQTETRREVRPGSALYRTAEDVARAVFETDEPIDITGNALMYHARGVTPYWASSSTTAYGTRRINNHVFYPRGEMPADPVAEAYVAVNGLRVARFAAETPAEQFGARANVYTPSIEELEAWNDDGNSTPLQRYAFDRLAARDFYGINDRGILSAVRDEVRQSPRQRIAEARAEQLRFAARKTAEAGAIERSYGSPPIERVSSGSLSWPTQSEIIVRELSPQYPTPLSSKGSAWTNFETPLTRQEERQFQAWKAVNAPDDSGSDYDLRGAICSTPSRNRTIRPFRWKASMRPTPRRSPAPGTRRAISSFQLRRSTSGMRYRRARMFHVKQASAPNRSPRNNATPSPTAWGWGPICGSPPRAWRCALSRSSPSTRIFSPSSPRPRAASLSQ